MSTVDAVGSILIVAGLTLFVTQWLRYRRANAE